MSNNETLFLQEIINDLVDSEKSLQTSLLKLFVFASKIKNVELVKFTTKEINGYENIPETPEYRCGPAILFAELKTFTTTEIKEIPISLLPEPYNSALQKFVVRDGISVIEKMAKQMEASSLDSLKTELPLEMLPAIQKAVLQLYNSTVRIQAENATITTNGNLLTEILSKVRFKLLNFVTDIGDEFGYSIDLTTFNKDKEKNNRIINNYMSTEIHNSGDGNIVNTGANSSITATITVSKGDLKALASKLESNGVDKDDIKEIQTIVQSEEPNYKERVLGKESRGWILRVIDKSMSGVGKIATGISSNILASMIKQYYGMDG